MTKLRKMLAIDKPETTTRVDQYLFRRFTVHVHVGGNTYMTYAL